jgi:hypothetical protein
MLVELIKEAVQREPQTFRMLLSNLLPPGEPTVDWTITSLLEQITHRRSIKLFNEGC